VRVGRSACGLLAVFGVVALLGWPMPGPARATSPTGAGLVSSAPVPGIGRLTLTSLAPDLVLAGSTLTVTGFFRNDGPTAVTDVEVRLRAVGPRLGTRVEVGRWLDGEDLREGVPIDPASRVRSPVPPGGRVRFTLKVPALALGLPGPKFGVFPIAVEALGTDQTGTRGPVALLRTTVQAQPAIKAYAEQRITWVVPLTGLPGTAIAARSTPDQVMAQVAHEVGPGSRLSGLLEAALTPGVVWMVDPQLLVTLQEAGREEPGPPTAEGPTPPAAAPSDRSTTDDPPGTTGPDDPGSTTGKPRSSPTPTQRAADRTVISDFLKRLRAEAPRHQVIALPYADPDLEALSSHRSISLVTSGRAAGEGVIEGALGVRPITDVAWPATGQVDDRAVRDLANQGYRSALLDGQTRPLVEALNYTPDARTTTLPGGVVGLLSDPQLSALTTSIRESDLAARSRLLAETAAVTTEREGLSRRLVVVVPRGVSLDGKAFGSTVLGAGRAPWLRPVPLTEVIEPDADSGDASELGRQVLPVGGSTGIQADDVRWVVNHRRRLSAFGEVVEQPVETTAGLQRDTLELLSAGWRGQRPGLRAQQREQDGSVGSVVGRVSVLPTTITFLRNSGELQLTVSNDLNQRVAGVRLRVRSTDARLVVDESLSRPLTLEPGTRSSVRVPVRALGGGQVSLQAQLLAPSGGPVGQAEQVRVRVRPTDSWVITAGGVLVALVLVVGLVRAVRRPRRQPGSSSDE
jgi:hypothetical protein